MRLALPNASFLGFTGTPLIAGEEETRRVFGDYVSIYNFRDSIADGATVPLYYENRIPELQLTNDDFDDELEDLLEEAALDDAQEKAVARRFSKQYELITRPQRLKEIAEDLVQPFRQPGFQGQSHVRGHRQGHRGAHVRPGRRPSGPATWPSSKTGWRARLSWSARTWSRSSSSCAAPTWPWWCRRPRTRWPTWPRPGSTSPSTASGWSTRTSTSKFKDPDDPFRLVFVCAMWLTGFDSPSTSSVYLDKPMRNHLLMQTIARANRVFPDKDNGLIVDYVGVFRNLEKALRHLRRRPHRNPASTPPIRPKDDLIAELDAALTEVTEFCDANDIDLGDMEAAQGFEFVALQKAAEEALRIDEQTRRRYVSLARQVRKTFKALLPDPEALAVTHRVAVIRSIASKIESSSEAPDISRVMDSVSDLLDRSVGAREYIIRSAGGADPLIDLNQLDFEQLALRLRPPTSAPRPTPLGRTSTSGSTTPSARTRHGWSWPSGSGNS